MYMMKLKLKNKESTSTRNISCLSLFEASGGPGGQIFNLGDGLLLSVHISSRYIKFPSFIGLLSLNTLYSLLRIKL